MSWARKSVKVRIDQKMRHCSTYLICLHSRAGMDVGVDEGLEVRGLQSDRGPKKKHPLANRRRGLVTREGERGGARLALGVRVRVSGTERDRARPLEMRRKREAKGEREGER